MVLFSTSFMAKNEQVRHVVVFKFKPSATPAQITQVTQALADLKNKIPGIVSFEHGVNNSPENKNLGFTHVFLLTFKDAAARDTYLPHPEHKKFGQLLGQLGVMEDVFVVDYSPAAK
ncbi:Dabb family protein [Adhaeribacter swui]|uniref:Dabb family protein n=1 Tax=Adhaeribacter swui TaxID=2086471 RepID=A0A7G7GEY0_9BACT|nr:Dabb family protein [Adhaeribacter swui]